MAIKKYSITKKRAKEFPKPDKGQVIYWDSKQAGLGLRITAADSRSWIYQGYVNGKSRRFTIAGLDDYDHEEARLEAADYRKQMLKGINPLEEKRKRQMTSAAEEVTLREIMEDYIEHRRTKNGKLAPDSIKGIKASVEKSLASWADKPVATIDRDAVVNKFRELSNSAPTQANLAFRNLRALLYWAREKYSTSDGSAYTILPVNPVTQALKQNGLAQWNKETAREERIPKGKIGAVWLALEEYSDTDKHIATTCTSADMIAFILLTGCRISEANKLTWDRVQLDDALPTLLLEITKNHTKLKLPISDALLRVLKRRYEAKQSGNPYVFPALRGGRGYLKDPRAILTRVSEIAGLKIRPHDLRRTFTDIAELAGVDSDKRRILVNHKGGDVHSINYENNKDPEVLLVEVQKVGNWVLSQADIALASKQGNNILPLKA